LTFYYKEKGDCNVPTRYSSNQKLANWVGKQRKDYKNNKLPQEKIEMLNAIGFAREAISLIEDARLFN